MFFKIKQKIFFLKNNINNRLNNQIIPSKVLKEKLSRKIEVELLSLAPRSVSSRRERMIVTTSAKLY